MDVVILFRVLARDSSISITREIFHIISIKSAFHKIKKIMTIKKKAVKRNV